MIKKLTGLTASAMALATLAQAEVKINEHLSLDGYVIAAGTITDPDTGKNTSTLADSGVSNFDAARIAVLGKYGDFSGKASLFYVPGAAGTEAGVLDAYGTYTAGPLSVTGGKFLSYLGLEAFEPVNMSTVSYGFASGIPAYATGAKIDYAGKGFSLGASVQDSLFTEPGTFFQGDGDWSDGLGYTVAATFTAIDKLTVFVGAGYDDDDLATDSYVFDFWASYALSDSLSIAGEVSYLESSSISYILAATYKFNDKISSVFRWSAQENLDTSEFATRLTVAPTYTLTENFAVRGEVSYQDAPKGLFYAVQGIFKF